MIGIGNFWCFGKLVTEERWLLTRGGGDRRFDCFIQRTAKCILLEESNMSQVWWKSILHVDRSVLTYLLSPICLVSCSYIEPVEQMNTVLLVTEIILKKIKLQENHFVFKSRLNFKHHSKQDNSQQLILKLTIWKEMSVGWQGSQNYLKNNLHHQGKHWESQQCLLKMSRRAKSCKDK